MDNFSFNSHFFPWNTTNPYMPNGFPANSITTPNQATFGTATPSQTQPQAQPHPPGLVPGLELLYGGSQRFPSGYPFGMNNSNFSTSQNKNRGNFNGPNWNFNVPNFTGQVDQQLSSLTGGQIIPPTTIAPIVQVTNTPVIPANNLTSIPSDSITSNSDKPETGQLPVKNELTDELAKKLLSNPTILQSAISQLQNAKTEEKSPAIVVAPNRVPDPVHPCSDRDSIESERNVTSLSDVIHTARYGILILIFSIYYTCV